MRILTPGAARCTPLLDLPYCRASSRYTTFYFERLQSRQGRECSRSNYILHAPSLDQHQSNSLGNCLLHWRNVHSADVDVHMKLSDATGTKVAATLSELLQIK